MSLFRSFFRKGVSTERKTPDEIEPGMKYKTVVRILGTPRSGSAVSGADILGRGSADPRAADGFLYFDKDPKFDYSIHFSRGKVVSIKEYPKPKTIRS